MMHHLYRWLALILPHAAYPPGLISKRFSKRDFALLGGIESTKAPRETAHNR